MPRNKTFLMRVDEAELAEIDRAAKEASMSRCAFVRSAALNATAQKQAAVEAFVEEASRPPAFLDTVEALHEKYGDG